MKRIIAIAVALSVALASYAQGVKSIYQKYSDAPDVSAVYISSAMFRMIGRIPDLNIDGKDVNLGKIIKSLTGMYIIDSSNPKVNADLKSDTRKFIDKGQYELLMEAKDNGETTRMYTMGNDTVVTGLVMLSMDAEDCTFICIDGQMNREDLERILSEKK